jgi:hypothetical protein
VLKYEAALNRITTAMRIRKILRKDWKAGLVFSNFIRRTARHSKDSTSKNVAINTMSFSPAIETNAVVLFADNN